MSTGPAAPPLPSESPNDRDEAPTVDAAGAPPPTAIGFQAWIERNRAKIWIWGIGGLALAGLGCMFLVVLLLVINR